MWVWYWKLESVNNHKKVIELTKLTDGYDNALFLSNQSLDDEVGVPETACVSEYITPFIFDAIHLEVSGTVNDAITLLLQKHLAKCNLLTIIAEETVAIHF